MKGFFKDGSPFIELVVESKKVEALLDTGFNGHLLLPLGIIEELGLDIIGISDYLTASGDKKLTKVYRGKINFLGEEIEVPILSTDADIYLAGMDLFHECKIIVERKKGVVDIVKSK